LKGREQRGREERDNYRPFFFFSFRSIDREKIVDYRPLFGNLEVDSEKKRKSFLKKRGERRGKEKKGRKKRKRKKKKKKVESRWRSAPRRWELSESTVPGMVRLCESR
jgi:hypothetical protein